MSSPHTNRLMDQARINLPGAIDGAMLVEFYSVLKEFFTRSNAWTEEIGFTTILGEKDYTLTPTAGAIIRLLGVVEDERNPVNASMATPAALKLSWEPTEVRPLVAHVVICVSDASATTDYPVYPQWIVDKYHNEILDGLLGRMMAQTAKPYSAPGAAMVRLRNFRAGTNQAKLEASRRNVFAAPAWRFPRSFAM